MEVTQLLALPPPPDSLSDENATPPLRPTRASFEATFEEQALSLGGKINGVPMQAAQDKLALPDVQVLPVVLAKNAKEYPERVNFCCHYCRCKYKTRPVGVPFKVDLKRNIFQCFGFFCGYNCAMKAAHTDKSSKIRNQSPSMITIMARRVSGITDLIEPSLPFETLRVFGGNLTQAQYHANRKGFVVVEQRARLIPFGFNAYKVASAQLVSKKRKKHVVRTAGFISKERKQLHNMLRITNNVKGCVRGALFEAKKSKRKAGSCVRRASKKKIYRF